MKFLFQLQFVPNCFSRFFSLKIMKLKGNLLTDVPFRIFLLPHLQTIDLSQNQLTSLPGSVMRRYLFKLDTLDVSGNERLLECEIERPPKIPVCTVSSLLEYSARVVVKKR